MARKGQPAVDLAQDAPLNEEALNVVQNLGAIAQGLANERDLMNQLLGQAQMAGAFEQFSRTVRTSKLAHVKENKLYRALAGMKSPDSPESLKGTWMEFCQLLGRSVDQVDEDIKNLRQFGEDALESMSRMGIGYRELRQWRRLPDDAKSALIEAAKQGNKEAVEYLAEELIARHTQEKEQLTQQLADTQADYEAQGALMAKKAGELDDTRMELERTRRQVQAMKPDERAQSLRREVSEIAFESEASITGRLREGFNKLAEHAEEHGVDHHAFMAGALHQLEAMIGALREEFHLPTKALEGRPAWMDSDPDTLPLDSAGA
ncbi:phage shock protein A [Pseudomonas alcaligenes]|nr:phage shock protein A [Pseudomonas alcaligenes]